MKFSRSKILFLVILLIIFALNFFSVQKKTLTYDEPAFYDYGASVLNLSFDKEEHRMDSKLPTSALNALPGFIGKGLKDGRLKEFLVKVETGRIVTILFSLLLAFIVLRWSTVLYGEVGGFVSLTLYAFSPNILAHSRLVSTDIYAACLVTASLYFFWRFTQNRTKQGALLSSSTLGLAQLAKYTCILLYPVYVVLIAVRFWPDIYGFIKTRRFGALFNQLSKAFLIAALFLVVSLLVINIGFLIYKTWTPFGEYDFVSLSMRKAQQNSQSVNNIPVPLPYPYLQGYDMTLHGVINPSTRSYLLGNLSKIGRGFKGYYVYAFFLKVPIAIQFFLLWAIVNCILLRSNYSFRREESFLLIPALMYFIYMNLFSTWNIGFRHVLLVMPLLFIFIGSLYKAQSLRELKPFQTVPTVILICYLIVSNLSYFPHYLSYFNEFVWDRKTSWRYLADSNLDYGQNWKYYIEYKDMHPGVIFEPREPVSGRVVVGANVLVGIWEPERFRWLRENFSPVDHIAYSYIVFDVTEEELERLGLRSFK